MKVTNLKEYHYQEPIVSTNDEGTKTESYKGANKVPFFAYIYPMDTKIDGQIYGQRINSMLRLLSNDLSLKLGLGICYKSDNANYRIVSLNEYTEHVEAVIEKI